MFKKIFLCCWTLLALAQNPNPKKTIQIIHSDFIDKNQYEIPGATLFSGNVMVEHDGITILCNKAYLFDAENYVKAYGNVQLNQGDSLYLDAKYAEYNGNKKFAFATGNVFMQSPNSTLETDTINFDRNTQQIFYNSNGTITNKDNILRSQAGKYHISQKKYEFRKTVTLTNPKYIIRTNYLDYYDHKGHAYLFGPSTVTSKNDYIYTEKGFYDTRKNQAYLLKNSYIKYENRKIKADSIFYNRNKEFASASRNIKITDSINKTLITGHYGEVYRNLKTKNDSLLITQRALIATKVENDTLYMHGTRIIANGPTNNRIIRAFKNVRFYKTDMSGKCDSIHSCNKTALTQLIGKPVMWYNKSQLTGEVIHLIGNNQTEKIDSLIIPNKAFLIQKDTIGNGYNQMKGQQLFGKFENNKLKTVTIVKNVESIYYLYNNTNQLVGINKSIASRMVLELSDNKIETVTFYKKTEGLLHPEAEFPENARKFRGFEWRESEQIHSKNDLFPPEEQQYPETYKHNNEPEKPMEPIPTN